VPVFFFALAPSLEKARSGRGERKLDERERERIKHHYAIGIHASSFGIVMNPVGVAHFFPKSGFEKYSKPMPLGLTLSFALAVAPHRLGNSAVRFYKRSLISPSPSFRSRSVMGFKPDCDKNGRKRATIRPALPGR
jgi:hypothetical protein